MSVPVGGGSSSEQVWTGFQWWPPNVTSGGLGGGPYLMSRVEGLGGSHVWCMGRGWGAGAGRGVPCLMSEVQWVIVGNSHKWTLLFLWTDRQTRVKTWCSRNFFGGRWIYLLSVLWHFICRHSTMTFYCFYLSWVMGGGFSTTTALIYWTIILTCKRQFQGVEKSVLT